MLSSQIELNGGAGNDVTLDASALPAGVTLSGGGTNRIFTVRSGQSVALKNLTLTGGNQNGNPGGAIYNGGTLALTKCTLSGNHADFGGGGGGAIFNDFGTLTLTQCSLSGNSADFTSGGGGGGAILNFGALTLTQCSLSGNSADNASFGGGGGAIYNIGAGTLTLTNSIVAQNTANNGGGPDILRSGGTLTRNGVNFIGDLANTGQTASATLLTGNALLAPLGNYGGPTQTMALLPGSLARNATTGSAITSDQRGFAIFGTADLGAYEAQLGPIAATTVNEDAATGAMAFSVGNVGTLSASSGNTVLVPSGNIALGGSGPNRTLAATPAPDANGSATLTVTDSLSGETQTFVLTVTPVNDAPSFTKGTDIYVPNISPGAQAMGGWATAISAGPANESGQVLTFTVTNTNNALFSTQPAVAANGTLTFTPAASKGGVATVSVSLTDDATAGGPALTSAVQTFTIRVLAVTNSNNIGTGSLRQAVLDAAVAAGADTIVFAPGVTGPIVLSTEISVADSGGVTLDASALPGGVMIQGGGAGSRRLFTNAGSSVLTLRGLTLTGGGGGSTVTNDGQGGAIFNNTGGTLTLEACTLTGNISDKASSGGGAIFNRNGATLTLRYCTLSGNSTATLGGAIFNARGGPTATASVTLIHCTVTGNTAGTGGGGIFNTSNVTLTNSIVAGNSVTTAGTGADIRNEGVSVGEGNLSRVGANLVQVLVNLSNGTLSGPAHNTSAPLLAPLGNYGGPTQTVALLPGSPARNAATVLSPAITSDQRGFPVIGTPDIGAYEAGTFTNYNAWIYETLPASTALNAAQHASAFDFDSDGVTNGNEWLALTDPDNNTSYLRVTQTALGGSNLNVTFPSVLGRNYTLEGTTDLALWPWTRVPNSATVGTGGVITIPIGPMTGIPNYFVRVRVGP